MLGMVRVRITNADVARGAAYQCICDFLLFLARKIVLTWHITKIFRHMSGIGILQLLSKFGIN